MILPMQIELKVPMQARAQLCCCLLTTAERAGQSSDAWVKELQQDAININCQTLDCLGLLETLQIR